VILFLALSACAPGPIAPVDVADASDDNTDGPIAEVDTPAARRPVELPAGKATVRQCFDRADRPWGRYASSSGGSPPPPPAAGTNRAAAPSAPSASAPEAAAAPAPLDLSGDGGAIGGGGSAEGIGRIAERKTDGFGGGPKEASTADGAAPARGEQTRARLSKSEPSRVAPPPQQMLDWGATVYLSNDDSMSLASAQRLLWAVQERGPVQAAHVRPHELLNYFSFDADMPRGSDVFGVKGSAAVTGDQTLTVAFAVKGAAPERGPLDLTLVLDRSGSMSAEGRMDYLKRGLRLMADQLQPGDRLDLVLFDDDLCVPLEDFVVGRDDAALLTQTIDQLAPRGSTDLDLGLREGYRLASTRPRVDGRSQRVMLISDALLNTGDVDPHTVSEVSRQYDARDIRLTAVGVGRDFNDEVLDMLSEKGKGAYVYLGSEAVVDRLFGAGFDALVQTIAHDVHFSIDLPPSLAMQRFYGEEASTVKADVQPIHYYAGTTQLFLQDLRIKDQVVSNDPVTFTVEWKDAETGDARTQKIATTVGALLEADPRNVRKGRALMAWTDLILARALGNAPCMAPFTVWQERVSLLGPDAEIAWLDGLTSPLCGAQPIAQKPAAASGVAYKVKVDSDVPIAEVSLACGTTTARQALSGSDTVARFDSTVPGTCTLTLAGVVPMQASVEVPSTGGDTRCVVRGGRVTCT
jgi:Ca-activated chloride channel family protein